MLASFPGLPWLQFSGSIFCILQKLELGEGLGTRLYISVSMRLLAMVKRVYETPKQTVCLYKGIEL